MNDTKKEEVKPPKSEEEKEKECCKEREKLHALLYALLGRL